MQFRQNFTCPLCLQLAKDAVQSTCCTKIFCQKCIGDTIKKFGHCPCCRNQNITINPSKIARKVISQIKIACEYCQKLVESGQMNNHLEKCPKVKIQCKICQKPLFQEEVPNHTAKEHHLEAKNYLVKWVLQHKTDKVTKVIPEKQAECNLFLPANNKFNRRAVLGTTSKYFCGGQLPGHCGCCDGHCGPDNGQNCDGCMELDVRRWNLARTYLVNPLGYVCQVIRAQGVPKVACFRILGSKKTSLFSKPQFTICHPGESCSACLQVQNSLRLGRYVGLY